MLHLEIDRQKLVELTIDRLIVQLLPPPLRSEKLDKESRAAQIGRRPVAHQLFDTNPTLRTRRPAASDDRGAS